MKTKVRVVDYGVGNLFSVCRAFETCGADVSLISSPTELVQADRLVLPGVGAFSDGMLALHEHKLVDALKTYASTGRPLLGICLGMQMLLDRSDEFGVHEGLGLISGNVVAIPATSADGQPHKIPHIGWNSLKLSATRQSWNKTLLHDTVPGTTAYFVHSFTAVPADENHRVADCDYDGRLVSAVIQSGAVTGCQFHPEKSGTHGLQMIRNFLKL